MTNHVQRKLGVGTGTVWNDWGIKKEIQLHWRLTSVILATQEAEIRRMEVQSQPRQTVCKTLPWKSGHKKGLVEWHKW
jgi:hypothetical protein